MPDEVAVRDLERDDLQPLLDLYQHLHAQDDALPATVDTLWRDIVRDPAHIYLGAFAGNGLVAACNAAIIPNLTRGARPYAVIENVVTHADYRRQGIGRKVLRALIDRCWAHRCYKIMLMSGVGRAEIHGFYEALGFDKLSKQAFVIKAP